MVNDIPTTSTLALNVLDIAHHIEMVLGQYLLPFEPGVYIKGSVKPLRFYSNVQELAQLNHLVQIGVSFDNGLLLPVYEKGKSVLSKSELNTISNTPTLPIIGIEMVSVFVDKIINDHSKWLSKQARLSLRQIWARFVKPEYRENTEFYDYLESSLERFEMQVLSFMGDDGWIMHFKKQMGFDILIEKTIDYRIMDWTKRMKEGVWE